MTSSKTFATKDGRKMWVELTNKESDWRECFKVVMRSFQQDPFYIYTHPDPEKRKKFLETYMNWLYGCIFKDDRGLLTVIKCEDKDGIVRVIGGMANTSDEDEDAVADQSSLYAVDEDGWKRHRKRDQYEWNQYIHKLSAVANKVGTTLMCGVFQSIDDGYRGQGIGTKFVMEGVKMMNDEIVRRKRRVGINDPKPPLAFCVCDHQRARNFTKNCGFIEVAEIPMPGMSDDKLTHLWVFIFPPKDPSWVEMLRQEFGYKAKL